MDAEELKRRFPLNSRVVIGSKPSAADLEPIGETSEMARNWGIGRVATVVSYDGSNLIELKADGAAYSSWYRHDWCTPVIVQQPRIVKMHVAEPTQVLKITHRAPKRAAKVQAQPQVNLAPKEVAKPAETSLLTVFGAVAAGIFGVAGLQAAAKKVSQLKIVEKQKEEVVK